MDSDYVNFAIYWVPQPGSALARFGAAWTGWCAEGGEEPGFDETLEVQEVAKGRDGVPGSIARHGLHANVKSPFSLTPEHSIWSLHEALDSLAQTNAAIKLSHLEVTVFDGQVVLALSRPNPEVIGLLRAVASVVDPCLEKPVYAENHSSSVPQPPLRDWGSIDMPVIERFHIPLTDRLELGMAYEVVAELRPLVDPILSADVVLSDLALVGDPGEGRPWRLLERYELSAAPASTGDPLGMNCSGPRLIASPFAMLHAKRRNPLCA